MPEVEKKNVIRVHIGYRYLLLDRTPANVALVDRLMNEPAYTTAYDADYRTSTHVLSGEKIASYAEFTTVDVCNLTEAEYREAIAEPVEPLAEAAE